jgi:hypothetical protein
VPECGVKEECAAFSYHLGMRVWLRVADPNTFLRSDFKNSLGMDYITSDSTMSVLQVCIHIRETCVLLFTYRLVHSV